MPIIIIISIVAAFLMQLLKEMVSKNMLGQPAITEKQAVGRIVVDAILYFILLAIIWNLADQS